MNERGMTFIVKMVTRLTLAFILLYGFYIALHGYRSPGGGFAGGIIVALSFVHIMLAFGKEAALKTLKPSRLRAIVGLAGIVLLSLALPFPWADGIPARGLLASFCDMILVGCGFFLVFIGLVTLSKSDGEVE